MKKFICILLCLSMILSTACEKKEKKDVKPESSQMKMICELATLECYYHNVAKYSEKDASGFWLWEKDKKFWVEYSGVVKIGVDASLIDIKVKGDKVSISLPVAKVLSSQVDEATLTKDSFIVADDSAAITADDQTDAYKKAQRKMVEEASKDKALLANAQQRAQSLLEQYVKNIGDAVDKEYTIEWNFINEEDK